MVTESNDCNNTARVQVTITGDEATAVAGTASGGSLARLASGSPALAIGQGYRIEEGRTQSVGHIWHAALVAAALDAAACTAENASPTYAVHGVPLRKCADQDFGIKNLYPDPANGGTTGPPTGRTGIAGSSRRTRWTAGSTRTRDGGYEVEDGALKITGPTSRMYIHDPPSRRQWVMWRSPSTRSG